MKFLLINFIFSLSDFLVVGFVGKKNVGKSTLANIIAHQSYLNRTFQNHHETFTTNGANCDVNNTLDMFITADRVILIDCSPFLFNVQKRDMMVSELDDIRTCMVLLKICHLLVVANDGFPDLSVLRIINLAELMTSNESKHRPLFASVANKIQPGRKTLQMDERIFDSTHLIIPDLNHPSVEIHHDVDEIKQKFQETVFMMKRWPLIESGEAFTEQKWGQLLVTSVDQIKKGDYFSRKYEALRDKFHQPVENC